MSYPADFQETLVAAASMATASLKLPNQMVEHVFTQYSPNYDSATGKTLTINVPNVSINNASDIGAGGITGQAPADTQTSLTISHKYSSNRQISTYDATLSANNLAAIYLAPIIEEVLRKTDNAICADMTTGNLPTNGSITGGNDVFTRANLATAWANLRAAGVPVGNPADCKFVTHSTVIGNMMAATEFSSESVVGIRAAEINQRQAVILPQFGFELVDDPYMPLPTSTSYAGVAFHKFFYGLRTVTPVINQGGQVYRTVVFPKTNVPVVVEAWYEPKDQSNYIHAFLMCGHGVVRENMAQYLVTT